MAYDELTIPNSLRTPTYGTDRTARARPLYDIGRSRISEGDMARMEESRAAGNFYDQQARRSEMSLMPLSVRANGGPQSAMELEQARRDLAAANGRAFGVNGVARNYAPGAISQATPQQIMAERRNLAGYLVDPAKLYAAKAELAATRIPGRNYSQERLDRATPQEILREHATLANRKVQAGISARQRILGTTTDQEMNPPDTTTNVAPIIPQQQQGTGQMNRPNAGVPTAIPVRRENPIGLTAPKAEDVAAVVGAAPTVTPAVELDQAERRLMDYVTDPYSQYDPKYQQTLGILKYRHEQAAKAASNAEETERKRKNYLVDLARTRYGEPIDPSGTLEEVQNSLANIERENREVWQKKYDENFVAHAEAEQNYDTAKADADAFDYQYEQKGLPIDRYPSSLKQAATVAAMDALRLVPGSETILAKKDATLPELLAVLEDNQEQYNAYQKALLPAEQKAAKEIHSQLLAKANRAKRELDSAAKAFSEAIKNERMRNISASPEALARLRNSTGYVTDEEREAFRWARDNPTDPRSAEIMRRFGQTAPSRQTAPSIPAEDNEFNRAWREGFVPKSVPAEDKVTAAGPVTQQPVIPPPTTVPVIPAGYDFNSETSAIAATRRNEAVADAIRAAGYAIPNTIRGIGQFLDTGNWYGETIPGQDPNPMREMVRRALPLPDVLYYKPQVSEAYIQQLESRLAAQTVKNSPTAIKLRDELNRLRLRQLGFNPSQPLQRRIETNAK